MSLYNFHYLVIKHGALGDVVRTSYFAGALRNMHGNQFRLSWITSTEALPLLRFNPHIDDLWTDFEFAKSLEFDCIFSLDDELEIVSSTMKLHTKRIVGAFLDDEGKCSYSSDAGAWFDMGILSRFGKKHADRLKKENRASHAEIFASIFGVPKIRPEFWGLNRYEAWANQLRVGSSILLGLNPYASNRWKSKELPPSELRKLIQGFLRPDSLLGSDGKIVLLGDRLRNLALAAEMSDPRIIVPKTEDSVLMLAAMVRELDYLITSDSLALHLAIAQGVHFLAFFAPTSANEIDDFHLGVKLISTATDYCSYKSDADNSSITAHRIMELTSHHMPNLFTADSA